MITKLTYLIFHDFDVSDGSVEIRCRNKAMKPAVARMTDGVSPMIPEAFVRVLVPPLFRYHINRIDAAEDSIAMVTRCARQGDLQPK